MLPSTAIAPVSLAGAPGRPLDYAVDPPSITSHPVDVNRLRARVMPSTLTFMNVPLGRNHP
jgi:hypothetical protein